MINLVHTYVFKAALCLTLCHILAELILIYCELDAIISTRM